MVAAMRQEAPSQDPIGKSRESITLMPCVATGLWAKLLLLLLLFPPICTGAFQTGSQVI
jgi:hypothetical protein